MPNRQGELEPGLRVRSATLPNTPIATIAQGPLKKAEGADGSGAGIVQVIRNEYVTNVPVEVLGKVGPRRVQVTGAFRPTDALIVRSSVPCSPGTLVGSRRDRPGHRGNHAEPGQAGDRGGDHSSRADSQRAAGRALRPRGRREPAPAAARPAAREPAGRRRRHDLDAVLSSSERSGAVWLLD